MSVYRDGPNQIVCTLRLGRLVDEDIPKLDMDLVSSVDAVSGVKLGCPRSGQRRTDHKVVHGIG